MRDKTNLAVQRFCGDIQFKTAAPHFLAREGQNESVTVTAWCLELCANFCGWDTGGKKKFFEWGAYDLIKECLDTIVDHLKITREKYNSRGVAVLEQDFQREIKAHAIKLPDICQ